jgi:large subunit ribosomal protein L24
LTGQIALKSPRVTLTPRLAARDARGILRFEPSELTVADLDGALAGGRVAGTLSFGRGAGGITTRSSVRITNADLAELLPGDGRGPLSGRVTFNVELEGTGRSPAALVGALQGAGTFSLQDGRILRLDPNAFAAVMRSVDLGLPIDTTRIRDRLESTLGNGALAIPLAEGEIVLGAGQAQLRNTMMRGGGADLAISGNVALNDSIMDGRLTLKGPEGAGGPANSRPELTIVLKGPVDAPKRTLDVAALTNWLALRAVDQQTKRIDALESGREAPANPYAADPPTATAPPAAAPGAAPQRPAPARRRTATTPGRTPPPTAGQAPAVPPPLDLRQFLWPR